MALRFFFLIFLLTQGSWAKVLNESSQAPLPMAHIDQKLRSQANLLKSSLLESGPSKYSEIKKTSDYKGFLEVTKALKNFDPLGLKTKDQKISFWVNVYNSMIIHGIIHFEIKKSVKDISNFFKKVKYQVGSYELSLDQIEHGILRANRRPPYSLFRTLNSKTKKLALNKEEFDPRIHFVLNCGASSCPPFAFLKAESLEKDLSVAMRGFLSTDLEIKEKNLMISKIFDWYSGDFQPSVLEYIRQHISEPDKLKAIQKISYRDYDWSLVGLKKTSSQE